MSKVLAKGIFETAPSSVSSGNDVDLHLTAKGYVIAVNADGTSIGGGTQYTEDVASVGGESLSLIGAVRRDTAASSSGTDGDYSTVNVDASGRLWTNPQGNVASGATDSGNPVKIGGVYNSSAVVLTTGQRGDLQLDASAYLKTREQYAPGYEDNTANVAKVENRYTSSGVLTGDTAVKSGAGFIHCATFSCNDAAPTAGSIIIYDNTAESGTQIFNHTFTTTPFVPFTIFFDHTVATGIYVGFTTTADVNVSVSYR